MANKIQISPSILSADFTDFAGAAAQLEAAGADMIHCDVMDGSFVRNISFGQSTIRDLRKRTTLPLDVHLMIVDPIRYIDEFVDAGADIVTVHAEACVHLQRALQQIRARGARAGVALNPATPPETLAYVMQDADLILCMSVNPGFSGQSFIPAVLDKIRAVRRMIMQSGRAVLLEVDGGVNQENASAVRDAGADVLVAGNAVFLAENKKEAVAAIRGA